MAAPLGFGFAVPPTGLGAPVGTDQTPVTIGSLANHPAVPALAFNSDVAVNSPTGTTNIAIASVSLPAGLLSPNSASAGLSGNLRRIKVRAYFQGANNANAKTAGIAFGAAANVVARCALTVSVVGTAFLEADITVDGNAAQTGLGYGIAATAAVGGTVTADVSTPVSLTQNLSVAQSIFFTAVTQTSAADIILNGYSVEIY